MSVQIRKSFVRLRNTILDILDENREVCDCPIECQVNNTVKAQKSMNDIIKNDVCQNDKKYSLSFITLR